MVQPKIKKKGDNKWELITTLTEQLIKIDQINHIPSQDIINSVLEREKWMGTELGGGLAIPHASIEGLKTIHALLMIDQEGMIYDSAESKPVHIVALLLLPEKEYQKQVKILTQVASLLQNQEIIENLLTEKDPDRIFSVIQEYESKSA